MSEVTLEHVNLTVSDPDAAAALLVDIFGWSIRWSGGSMLDGRTVHVGGKRSYIAFYRSGEGGQAGTTSYHTLGAANHVAVVVDDLDAVEARVVAAGFTTENHGAYEPGRRFYFRDREGIEYEVVSYGA